MTTVSITITDKDNGMDVEILTAGLDHEPEHHSLAYIVGLGITQALPQSLEETKQLILNEFKDALQTNQTT